jgi:hypothetical protein
MSEDFPSFTAVLCIKLQRTLSSAVFFCARVLVLIHSEQGIFDVPALIRHEVAKGSRLKICALNSGPLFRAFGWTCAAATVDVLCMSLSFSKKRHFAARHREGTLFIRAHIRVSRRVAVAEKGSCAQKVTGRVAFSERSALAKTNSARASTARKQTESRECLTAVVALSLSLSLFLCLIMRPACSDDYKASFSIFAYKCLRACGLY